MSALRAAAIATALVSALSGIPVKCDVAMTGEITLRGKVLAIGGLREKTMAAYKAGVKTVVVPEANRGDMDEVEDIVKENLNFVFAENISDVLDVALAKKNNGKPVLPVGAVSKSKKNKTLTVGN